ncbi:N-acetylglucosamine-6-phosphate deacetylase [Spirulina sp. CS-785/01]|uniref:N-acetylglucosamine-6-phosphate deacetylase n=1 Tax=Spirulina sp. CS-785/01 TaxID=3021716 RepID=UPI00232DCC9F|nr:N-acetylglucosamine-6-phosphate deacetylase [Spirulina sp. CS-785/01]MDB9313424.1 N-acetylglucosamine-6-phosphate deacetylase [Spirulina sp. CS-785/01]
MLNNCTIINARLVGLSELQQITIRQGHIQAIRPQTETATGDILDLAGDWLSLGGIDLQINGGLGLAFPDLTPQDIPILPKISHYLWTQGIDSYCPTLVTTAIDKIQQSLAVFADFLHQQPPQNAKILGIHLEGPFLNPKKRGAHPEKHLLPLTLEQVKRVIGEYGDIIKIITLAPELDPTGDTIPYLRNQGITVSLGHSLATAEQAKTAFQQGASMVTHAFNAMPGLHHRNPGLLGEAMTHEKVFCGFIADGQHICPTMLQILLRAAQGKQGLFLVSDALAPIGLPDGMYPWDSRKITVKAGTARLPEGTLAGTTLPLLVGVENLVRWGVTSIETAIALATESPRQAIGLKGLSVGQPASFLRWSQQDRLTWQRLG